MTKVLKFVAKRNTFTKAAIYPANHTLKDISTGDMDINQFTKSRVAWS